MEKKKMNILDLALICSLISLPFSFTAFIKIIVELLIVQITISASEHKFHESRYLDCLLAPDSVAWTQ